MTVIVYRDGVIAADTGFASGGHRSGSVLKIFQNHLLVGGASGVVTRCHAWGRWLTAGAQGEFRQDPFGEDDWNAFSVDEVGSLRHYDNDGWFDLAHVPYYAIGSGKMTAMGAMWQGATAAQAVAAALAQCEDCGGRVYSVDVHSRVATVWDGVSQHG